MAISTRGNSVEAVTADGKVPAHRGSERAHEYAKAFLSRCRRSSELAGGGPAPIVTSTANATHVVTLSGSVHLSENTMKLNGKTALVTGGTTGIGLETAKLLRDEGARVIVTGVNEERLANAARELGENVIVLRADLRKPGDLRKMN